MPMLEIRKEMSTKFYKTITFRYEKAYAVVVAISLSTIVITCVLYQNKAFSTVPVHKGNASSDDQNKAFSTVPVHKRNASSDEDLRHFKDRKNENFPSSVSKADTIKREIELKLFERPKHYNLSLALSKSRQKGPFKYKILTYLHEVWMDLINFSQCEYNNCIMTSDKSEFPTSDVVIFSMNDATSTISPTLLSLHKKRPPGQIWMFESRESPQNNRRPNYDHPFRRGVFNWSMNLRLDAEIPHLSGRIVRKVEIPRKDYHQIYANKTKFAAWVVSNCYVIKNKRVEYVKLLQQFIPVDVYGGCASVFNSGRGNKRLTSAEMDALLPQYKFYLSFENSNCKDYITEKVFKRWKYDFLLIVRGGADYTKQLPNGTYINTADFKSIKELAEYLKRLSANEDDYIQMLKVKDQYEDFDTEQRWVYIDAICNICKKVNNPDKYRHVYQDTVGWVHSGTCRSATDLVPG